MYGGVLQLDDPADSYLSLKDLRVGVPLVVVTVIGSGQW